MVDGGIYDGPEGPIHGSGRTVEHCEDFEPFFPEAPTDFPETSQELRAAEWEEAKSLGETGDDEADPDLDCDDDRINRRILISILVFLALMVWLGEVTR
jgi:hypothetical protein